MMVQGAGFEPAKHYAQRPERCPFDHSGTPARSAPICLQLQCSALHHLLRMVQGAGFEPAKHYALGPKPSPFDHSGTPA